MSARRSLSFLMLGLVLGLLGGYFFVYQTFIGDLDVLRSTVKASEELISSLQEEVGHLWDLADMLNRSQDLNILGVYFSPKGGCADQVIYWVGRANYSVHAFIYSFTLDSVGDAFIDAYTRGVDVKVVFEKSQVRSYSQYFRLKAAGVEVRNDTNSKLMHDKVLVIDGHIVLTGSFNWSANAENYNNENLVVIDSHWVANIFEDEFERIWNNSV